MAQSEHREASSGSSFVPFFYNIATQRAANAPRLSLLQG